MKLGGVPYFGMLLCAACGREPTSTTTVLGNGVARVGPVSIAEPVVRDVALKSAVAPRPALDELIADALVATSGQAEGMDRSSPASWGRSVALARRVVMAAASEASARGAPSTAELEVVRVAHALVTRSTRVSADRARGLAEAIRKAVTGSSSVDEFEARAKAIPHSDAQVLVERLDGFQADGLLATGRGEFDRVFVAAAFALRSPAELSPVVETRFGWHVIFLVARQPPGDGAPPQSRDGLATAVMELRARTTLQAILRARGERSPIALDGAADSLMARVGEP
jgi:parvulin-like peptidyl-prolyl isomerase